MPLNKILEIIYGVFFLRAPWLAENNQSRAAISTSAVPPHVRAF